MTDVRRLEIKQWLNRAFHANNKAKALARFAEQCRENAQGTSINYEGNDAGKSGSSENGTEKAYIKLAEAEEKARQQKQECERLILEIQNVISTLHDDELEAVLINRYLNFMSVERTAEFMHYDSRTVMRKVNKAIEKLSPNVT